MKNKKAKKKEFDRSLLKILVCPVCKSDVNYHKAGKQLVCVSCKRTYAIREGIPIMLPDEAKK